MNKRYNMNVVIINKGQLKFALEKTQTKLYGQDQYPELYQKAAILMETITKIHTLSDGNKRTAMMAAEFMIKANGGELVLPLKSIRLSVNTAMDGTDSLSGLIQKWFKIHTAMNHNQLCFMLRESMEEESIIKTLWSERKFSDAETLLSEWMAFDSYPENKKAWGELSKQWKQNKKNIVKKSNLKPTEERAWSEVWDSIVNMGHRSEQHSENLSVNVKKIEDLHYNHNTMDELDKMESLLKKQEKINETTTDSELIHQNGLILVLHGNLVDSLDLFKKLNQLDDDKSDSLLHMGLIYHELRDYENAIECWIKSLEIDSNDSIVLYNMCITLIELEKYGEALTYVEKIPQEKLEPRFLYSKAVCLDNLGKIDDAVEILEKQLSENSENATINARLGSLYSEKQNFEKALSLQNKVIELEPDNYQGYYNKALTLNSLEQYDEEIKLYDKVLEMEPDNAESWINKGGTLSNQGKFEDGIMCIKRGLEIAPENLIGVTNMGITLCKLGKYDESLRCYENVLRVDFNNTRAIMGKSIIYARKNQILECLSNLEKVLRINPSLKVPVKNDDDHDFDNVRDSEKFKELIK